MHGERKPLEKNVLLSLPLCRGRRAPRCLSRLRGILHTLRMLLPCSIVKGETDGDMHELLFFSLIVYEGLLSRGACSFV